MAASTGRGARAKGSNFERMVSKYLTEKLGVPVKRVICSGINGEGDLEGLPVHVELKRQERLALNQYFLHELPKAEAKGLPLVLIHKRNHEQAYVTMTLDDWTNLFKEVLVESKGCEEGTV